MSPRLPLVLLLAFTAGSFAGCSTTQTARIDDAGMAFEPRNVSGAIRWPGDIRRVAVLPVADATSRLPETFAATYDSPWLAALQQSQRAEFVPIDRLTYTRWTGGTQPPVSTAVLPTDWARRIIAATGADAALLVDITHCSPYAPLALGLRVKLIRLETGQILWTADETFDASQPAVARAARRYARAGQLGRDGEAIAILQSPSKFAAYAAAALADSLPPR